MRRVRWNCRSGCASCPHTLTILDDGEEYLRRVDRGMIRAAFTIFLSLCYGSFHGHSKQRKRRTQTIEREVEKELAEGEKGETERGWDLMDSSYEGFGSGR